jgi:hypothetical protein
LAIGHPAETSATGHLGISGIGLRAISAIDRRVTAAISASSAHADHPLAKGPRSVAAAGSVRDDHHPADASS